MRRDAAHARATQAVPTAMTSSPYVLRRLDGAPGASRGPGIVGACAQRASRPADDIDAAVQVLLRAFDGGAW